ncbi:hypothetical protein B0H15DRAFT_955296 [Mycena belliarum]|uniref:Uncharacterized protein n=1 Tax=Mycena belliarum TaxID=1033014 RepID=A0AAD6XGB3_9AGAR|nr:hypothetical protein B0H15DRAFT_955296 [Mycena belliae]
MQVNASPRRRLVVRHFTGGRGAHLRTADRARYAVHGERRLPPCRSSTFARDPSPSSLFPLPLFPLRPPPLFLPTPLPLPTPHPLFLLFLLSPLPLPSPHLVYPTQLLQSFTGVHDADHASPPATTISYILTPTYLTLTGAPPADRKPGCQFYH